MDRVSQTSFILTTHYNIYKNVQKLITRVLPLVFGWCFCTMQQWYCFLFSFFTCLHSSSHVYLIQMLMISLGDLTAEIKMTNSWSNNAMFEVIIHNSNPSVVYSDVWVKIDYMFSYSNVYGMTRTDSAVGMFPLPHTPWLLKTIEMIRIPCYNPISIKNYNTKTKELIHSAFAFILILIFILFFLFKKRREKKKKGNVLIFRFSRRILDHVQGRAPRLLPQLKRPRFPIDWWSFQPPNPRSVLPGPPRSLNDL